MEAGKPKEQQKQQSDQELIEVSVRSRNAVLYEGKVEAVTSYNEVGEFDVLGMHANFVTLIKDKLIVNKGREGTKEIEVKSGLMNVTRNQVDVYVGI